MNRSTAQRSALWEDIHFCYLGLFILSRAYGATAVHFLPVSPYHTIHKPSSGSLSFAWLLELMTKDPFKKKEESTSKYRLQYFRALPHKDLASPLVDGFLILELV